MSRDEELLPLGEDASFPPVFASMIRGYDKRQVDEYVAQLASDVSMLSAEREAAFDQIQGLVAQNNQLQAEMRELRQRPSQVDRASFRHLGPMVDQILSLAEKQSEAITAMTAQRAANHRAEAERVLTEAHEQAEKLRAAGSDAQQQAEQEAQQIRDRSAEHIAQTRAEAEAMIEAARAQAQQEGEAAATQLQQEAAQRKSDLEREIGERRAAADDDLAQQRTVVEQKLAALQADAQRHAADLRRHADEQHALHQQRLADVQKKAQAHQETLTRVQAELEAARHELSQVRQAAAATTEKATEMQRRLDAAHEDLTSELARLDEARRAAELAERHAKDVRARVQREAKRVADLAAAAVMAAAAGGDTGEYPQIVLRRPAEPAAGGSDRPPVPLQPTTSPDPVAVGVPEPGSSEDQTAPSDSPAHRHDEAAEPAASASDPADHPRARHDADAAIPAPRQPQPQPQPQPQAVSPG